MMVNAGIGHTCVINASCPSLAVRFFKPFGVIAAIDLTDTGSLDFDEADADEILRMF